MHHLDALENKSIYLIREAHSRFKSKALLWSMGKDSTVLLWLCRKAFFGNIPFPVIHLDTSYKFKEIYAFREKYSRQWNLDLIISRNEKALKEGMNYRLGRSECCNMLKTETLKMIIAENGIQAALLAIRRDEHGIRAKERSFSPRNVDQRWDYQNQPPELWDLYKSEKSGTQHFRVHPMLHWSELDVWEYIKHEQIPLLSLYLAKKGQRYRSIGCETCCSPTQSNADNIPKIIEELKTTSTSERGGRAQDKEDAYTMQKLRSLGYM
jgi:sulfate adenylyltransferase subunit 2